MFPREAVHGSDAGAGLPESGEPGCRGVHRGDGGLLTVPETIVIGTGSHKGPMEQLTIMSVDRYESGSHGDSSGMSLELDTATLLTLRNMALEVARAAGDLIAAVYGENGKGVDLVEVREKADRSPVTTADMAAHELILEALSSVEPGFPVISEESGTVPFAERREWPAYWLVDPLDGTREFLRRNGEFTVNIALVIDNRSVMGVIVAPVLGVAYHAVRGQGAFKRIGEQSDEPIHTRSAAGARLTVARSRCPVTGPNLQRFLDALGEHDEVRMGAALKSCLVAEGAADVYARLGPTGEWDTGAAQCIVEEAGGHITDMNLNGLRYNTRETLINPHFLVFGDARVDWAEHLAANPAAAS